MEQFLSLFLKVLFVAHLVRSANIEGRVDPLVLTSQGLVRGLRSTEGDFSIFAGIPYAQVNTSNPFGSALPAPIFEDVFEAYDEQVACPQTGNYFDWETTLDCLRLNIYVPNQANSRNPLPVFVWVHGGGFIEGKAGQHSPRHLVPSQGIVLVTINYRLGPYGFMCLNTTEVPGNAGLKDQVAALRWVRQNIAAFGGNPYQVTIAGQSAGSSSVDLHMYSPQERLFHRAILHSGTSNPLMTPNDELAAIKLAGHLGFVTEDTDSAIEFLSKTPTQLVTEATVQLRLNFGACVEKIVSPDSFVPTNPLLATFPRKTNNMPVMIGVTTMEFLGFSSMDVFYDSFKEGVKDLFDVSGEELDSLSDIVQRFYVGDENDSSIIEFKLEQMDSDLVQNYPFEREVTKMVQQGVGPVYNYVFEYVSENDPGDRETNRAVHAAELKYLFSYTVNTNGSFNEEEQEISDRICAIWGNFIRSGNPNSESSGLPWPAVSAAQRPHLVLGREPRVGSRFEHANVAFWELFYKAYADRDRVLGY